MSFIEQTCRKASVPFFKNQLGSMQCEYSIRDHKPGNYVEIEDIKN